MTTYFCSDHHLFHDKIIEFERTQFRSIEEHNQFILDKHNSIVKLEDTVYFLGDVCLSVTNEQNYDILLKFNGHKRLILGNHETPSRIKLYDKYFEKISAYHTLHNRNGRESQVILSHIPVHPSQLEDRFEINIHGHLHSNSLNDSRYFCVSMEQIDYTPITLTEILKKI